MQDRIDAAAFGERVRERRQARGWSQTKLAKVSGYSQTNIGWIEDGSAKDPRKQVVRLAEALQTTQDYLLYGRGPKDVGPPVMTAEQYEALPVEVKAALTAIAEPHIGKKKSA